jgi:hypothetical protein
MLNLSSSGFDPTETLTARRFCPEASFNLFQ